MQIHFLWWKECPSHPEAWTRLQQVLAEMDVTAQVERIEITSDALAEQWQFPGSPTILINGTDIDPAASQFPARLTCRLYRTEDGRPSPVPTLDMIRDAIQSMRDEY